MIIPLFIDLISKACYKVKEKIRLFDLRINKMYQLNVINCIYYSNTN